MPQYQLLEQAIIGGGQAYTAAGLPSYITGEAVKKSPITGQPKEAVGALQKLKLKALGLLGIPVSLRTSEQQAIEQESLQRATTQMIGERMPMLSSQFKSKLREEIKLRLLKNLQQKSIIEGIF